MNPLMDAVNVLFTSLSWLTPLVALALWAMKSFHRIGPAEVGLVTLRYSWHKLPGDNPIAFKGEAGYQADMLMPGMRWKTWPFYRVEKHPWVQIPAGEIGVVIAQIGQPTKIGAKSAEYKPVFSNFQNLGTFVNGGGQKGVQRPVLQPGTLAPIHPVAFLVITKARVYGVPMSADEIPHAKGGVLTPESFNLRAEQLNLVRIDPKPSGEHDELIDQVGIVTALDGDPLMGGDIASRIGGFTDIVELEQRPDVTDAEIIERLLGSKNNAHNSYQDFQMFIENGGKIGLQHDVLLYGAYALNPFLVKVELAPMLVVKQGQAAVIKAYVGLPTRDTSGPEFKFGSLVRPGHRGVWQESLRTGKYAINPRCYQAEIVPTAILTLNWAKAESAAHHLDAQLSQIHAKSSEGFDFMIDLQVQIHVPDSKAPRVISMVGSMLNLVNEVLQPAVGNHFRDTLQGMKAIDFIQKRQEVQTTALAHIKEKLGLYEVETPGVYIQDVILPEQLVKVLTDREVANQQIATYGQEKLAEDARKERENARGVADQQSALATSQVKIEIKTNDAQARIKEAEGEATYLRETNAAEGEGRAKGFKAQQEAIGADGTAIVNLFEAIGRGHVKVMPEILVMGGGGAFDALASVLTKRFSNGMPVPAAPAPKGEEAAVVTTGAAAEAVAEKV